MAYFPHAYQKLLLAKSAEAAAGVASSALSAGEVGLLNATTYQSVAIAAQAGGPATSLTAPMYILAQGSLHSVDKLGPFHGGYQESVKSKGINPKYVSAIWKSDAAAEVAATLTVEAQGDCFKCGVERYLRLDVKGSPALRFLGRNAYFVADWTEYCCATGQTTIDPYVVLSKWAEQIGIDPLVSPFVTAVVQKWDSENEEWISSAGHTVTTSSHGKFRIVLTAKTTTQISTHFGDCGFRPTDHYELEPIQLFASELDETGDACNVACTTIASTVGTQKKGSGESVIRQLILSNRYEQDPFQQDARMREILNEVAFNVDRTASYNLYHLLHSVPRKSNPSGTMDNDQYLISIAVDSTDATTNARIDDLLVDLGKAAGLFVNAVTTVPAK
jgi:hypothetical protein